MRVLDTITIQFELKNVMRQLRLDTKMGYSGDVRELVGIAESLIQAKAVYEVSYISQRGEDTVEVNGATFTSRVLRVNLDKVERVFPFIITIGSALEDNASSSGDLLRQFYLETMGNMALRSSRQYLEEYLKRHFGLGPIEDEPLVTRRLAGNGAETPLLHIRRCGGPDWGHIDRKHADDPQKVRIRHILSDGGDVFQLSVVSEGCLSGEKSTI